MSPAKVLRNRKIQPSQKLRKVCKTIPEAAKTPPDALDPEKGQKHAQLTPKALQNDPRSEPRIAQSRAQNRATPPLWCSLRVEGPTITPLV